MPAHPAQFAVTAGEFSPALYARADISKYVSAAELLQNLIVKPTGGAARRAGTYFIEEVASSARDTMLQPFIFSQDQAYILEFQGGLAGGNGTIRVYRNRAIIEGQGDGVELITNGAFPADISGWTATVTGTGTVAWNAGVARLNQGAAGTARIAQSIAIAANTAYILEFDVIGAALSFQVGSADGLADIVAAATYQVGHHRVQKPVAVGTTIWVQWLATANANSDLDNVTAQKAEPLEVAHPYQEADLFDLRFRQINDVLYIFHRGYATRKLLRLSDVSWELRVVTWAPFPAKEVKQFPQADLTLSAVTGTAITVTASSAVFLDGDIGKIIQIGAGRASITAFTSTTVVTAHVIDDFSSVGPHARNLWSTLGSPSATLTPSEKDPVGQIITLTATVRDAFRSTDVDKFVQIHGGLVRITAFTSATVVSGEILVSLSATAAAVAGAWLLLDPAWSAALGFPECGTLHEGRLVLARDDTFWGSATGDFENFGIGGIADTAYEFQMGIEITRTRWIEGGGRVLLIGTVGGEISARGPTEEAISVDAVPKIMQDQKYGSSFTCAPVTAGGAVLFVDRSGRILRELAYVFETDKNEAPNLSILADHLFAGGTIRQLARMTAPETIVFAVRDDGMLLTLTYEGAERVVGWTRQITGPDQGNGTELVTNGTFPASLTGWTATTTGTGAATWSGGKAHLTQGASGTARLSQEITGLLQNTTYRVEFDVSGSPVIGQVGTADGAADALPPRVYLVGHHQYDVRTAGVQDNLWIQFLAPSAATVDIDNVSIQVLDIDRFESVAVIPSMCGTADEVWVAVRRTIGGVTKRFIEVFDGNLQTDCALVYEGTSVGVVNGLSHLNGEPVWVKVGKISATEMTVSAGAVTLASPATFVEVGLGYTSRFRTLRLGMPTAAGSNQGLKQKAYQVIVRFGCVGTGNGWTVDGQAVSLPNQEIVEDFVKPAQGWDRKRRVTVEQAQPFAGTVLMVAQGVELESG